jgi:transcriptional regulator with XRE-family HTH domain
MKNMRLHQSMSFAQHLRAYRRAHHISQAQLAALIPSFPKATLQRWELGHTEPAPWAQSLILDCIARSAPPAPSLTKTDKAKIAASMLARLAKDNAMQTVLVDGAVKMTRENENNENNHLLPCADCV